MVYRYVYYIFLIGWIFAIVKGQSVFEAVTLTGLALAVTLVFEIAKKLEVFK